MDGVHAETGQSALRDRRIPVGVPDDDGVSWQCHC